jgi:hypothetical protein
LFDVRHATCLWRLRRLVRKLQQQQCDVQWNKAEAERHSRHASMQHTADGRLLREWLNAGSKFDMLPAWILAFALGSDPSSAIAKNAELLSSISSYHLEIESHSCKDDVPGAEVLPIYSLQVWHSGARRHRLVRRDFLDTHGARAQKVYGDVADWSVDGTVQRRMTGWDEQHPYKLPLEFGRNAKEYGEVRCSIMQDDPTSAITNDESVCMLWQLRPGWTLSRMAEVCEFVEVPQSDPSITRLKFASTSVQELSGRAYFGVGSTFDIDMSRGGMVTRTETPSSDSSYVTTVAQSVEAAPGVWIPLEIRTTFKGDLLAGFIKVNKAEINQPISEESLTTQFPEGARVDEFPGYKVHIWGKGQSAESFTSFEKYMARTYAKARDYQQGPAINPVVQGGDRWKSFFVVLNLGLIAVVVALFVLRRRIGSR